MEEIFIYPEGRAEELEPDSIVHVIDGDAYSEKMVQNLNHGDVYSVKLNRTIKDKTLQECMEFFLLNRMQVKFRTGDQSEVQGSDIMILLLDDKEVAFFPTDDEYIMDDFLDGMRYVIDAEEEKEY